MACLRAPTPAAIVPSQHDLTIMKVFTSLALARDLLLSASFSCFLFFFFCQAKSKTHHNPTAGSRQQKVIQNTHRQGGHIWELVSTCVPALLRCSLPTQKKKRTQNFFVDAVDKDNKDKTTLHYSKLPAEASIRNPESRFPNWTPARGLMYMEGNAHTHCQ